MERERHTYLTLLPPERARDLWFERIGAAGRDLWFERIGAAGRVLEEEAVPLRHALRRTLSRAAEALRSSPAFHGAAMDGWAVRAEATFSASPRHPLRLRQGTEAFPVNTGRPLPPETNAVIMVENVNVEGEDIVIEKAAFPWQHVRKLGEDMVATEILLPPGTVIGAHEIGALAAGGVLSPMVFRRPRMTVIPSGSEIRPLDEASEEDLRAGRCLPEFNSLVFAALADDVGAETTVSPVVPDDPAAIAAAVTAAVDSGADLVVVNAGSSAGTHDFTADVLADLGEVFVHGVALMPGKPTVLGMVRGVPVMGAPGYPVSAVVAFEEFAVPLLALWQKRPAPRRERVAALPCNPLPSRPGMEERIRVKLGMVGDAIHAVPLPRGAGTVTSLSRADAVIRVPADREGVDGGEPVTAELLRPRAQIEGALLAIGSHDNTLDLIDSMLRRSHPRFRLTSAHVGSLGGLLALERGQCHLAGSHLLDPDTGVYNRRAITENLSEPVLLIRLVDREQGLILAPGNPRGIGGLDDLGRPDIRIINRQRGSGTRLLLDYELSRRGIDAAGIAGYREEEYTHMNVAAAVLSGRADAGLGVRSAAAALGLEFIPVGVEEYDLVIPARHAEDERILALLDVIRSPGFREAVLRMGGYGVDRTGDVVWEYGGRGNRA